MWKFNGTTFTDEEINKYSEEVNMSVDEYVDKFKVEKDEEDDEDKEKEEKKDSPTKTDPVVGETIALTITEPPLEDISLESLDTDVKTGTSANTVKKEVKKSTDTDLDITVDTTIEPSSTRTSSRTDVRKRDLEKKKEGKLVYGDQRDFDQQISDYNNSVKNVLNAQGNYEYLQDYSKEERLNFAEKLAKPKYTESIYNENTDSYETVTSKNLVNLIDSYLPSDIELYKTPEQFKSALIQGVDQAFKGNPVLKTVMAAREFAYAKQIDSFQQTLGDKYDLSVPENVDKANKELNEYIKEVIIAPFTNSDLVTSTYKQYREVAEKLIGEKNKEFGRLKTEGLLKYVYNVYV